MIPDVLHVKEPIQIILHFGPPLQLMPGCSLYRAGDRLLVTSPVGMDIYEMPVMSIMGIVREADMEEANERVSEAFHESRKPANMH